MGRLGNFARPLLGCGATFAELCLASSGIPKPTVLLLLGHMRSGSTLMLHLLMTNSEVAAIGERNATYASRRDLARLAMTARLKHRAPLRRLRYVVDQVNHNKFTPNAQLLQQSRVRFLFLLRRPRPTIASILQLQRRYYPQVWSTARAIEYYVERLQFLTRLAGELRDATRAAHIEYETLTAQPDQTLRALQAFLGLPQEFSKTYGIHAFTQTLGDPGPRIISGRILPDAWSADVDLDASESELERAVQAYGECHHALGRFALLPVSVATR